MKSPADSPKSRLPLTLEERRAISRQRREDRIATERKTASAGRMLDAGHPHWSRDTLPDRRPLVDGNMVGHADLACHRAALDALGVRPIPYPFASIVAIVSDVDGSVRPRYAGYIGQIVNHLGLDFGDSTWLTPQYIHEPSRPTVSIGFGFFSRRFDDGISEPDDLYKNTRTLAESLIEFHKGNVDHFHSLLPNGPKAVVSPTAQRNGRIVSFAFDQFVSRGLTGARNFFLTGICAICHGGTSAVIETIEIETIADGPSGDFAPAVVAAHGDRARYLFEAKSHPGTSRDIPHLPQIRRIQVVCVDDASASAIDRLVLMSASSNILRDRVHRLSREFNVETSLITDHSAFHFRNDRSAPQRDDRLRELVALDNGKGLSAVYGTVCNEAGEELFTTESDDSRSLFQVLPWFTSELGGAYVVPAGGVASRPEGWDTIELVSPSLTRSGDGIYVAQRSMPPPADDPESRVKSHASTMAQRIVRTLDRAAEAPGATWPIYTHLGGIPGENIDGVSRFDRPPPDPYFSAPPFNRLQDAAFNLSGGVAAGERIWFTRATQAYDYSLMLRGLPANAVRIDPDTVEITSWTDRILDQTMPRSPAMLNGVTFYCDDPARAVVRLDDRVLALARNPADETGRCSVTVAETDLRFGVFSRLDPVRRSAEDTQVEGGAWDWRGDHGTLSPAHQAAACLRIALDGWHPGGSQALSFRLRRSAGSLIGILLETETGGRFFFGDVAHRLADCDASYALERHAAPPGNWLTIVVPFTDLEWRAGAAPGGPMPNHALTAMTLMARDAPADFADVAFLRPRSTSLSQRVAPLYCLAGTVPEFVPGQSVNLAMAEGEDGSQSVVVDQRGAFCFTGLVAGIYRLWSDAPSGRRIDRRGELIEVIGDIATVALVRAG